jgi:hypothetical protein
MENNSGKIAAQAISDLVNKMAHQPESKAFVDEITHSHRTLQQQSFELFMQCIAEWAKTDRFDDRNEYTVKTAKKIVAALDGEFVGRVPFI